MGLFGLGLRLAITFVVNIRAHLAGVFTVFGWNRYLFWISHFDWIAIFFVLFLALAVTPIKLLPLIVAALHCAQHDVASGIFIAFAAIATATFDGQRSPTGSLCSGVRLARLLTFFTHALAEELEEFFYALLIRPNSDALLARHGSLLLWPDFILGYALAFKFDPLHFSFSIIISKWLVTNGTRRAFLLGRALLSLLPFAFKVLLFFDLFTLRRGYRVENDMTLFEFIFFSVIANAKLSGDMRLIIGYLFALTIVPVVAFALTNQFVFLGILVLVISDSNSLGTGHCAPPVARASA
jgi:hypothetical protein